MFLFEGLDVYQKSIRLTDFIFEITSRWPKEYIFNLTDQIRRASLSVPLNIAEGSGRYKKEFQRFLDISKGSCFECVAIVDIACRRKLISVTTKEKIYNELELIGKMISKLKNSMN